MPRAPAAGTARRACRRSGRRCPSRSTGRAPLGWADVGRRDQRQYPLLDRVRVRVEQRAVAAHDERAVGRAPVLVAVAASPGPGGRVARRACRPRAGQPRDDVDERQPGRDDEALQHAEGEHARERERAKTIALRRTWAKRRSSATSKKPDTATIDDRRERGLRQVLEQRREERAGEQEQPRRDDGGQLARPPAPSAAAVWLAPPDCTKPDEKPGERGSTRRAPQVAVGVDEVAVLDRERARDADRLGGQRSARRGPASTRLDDVVRGDVRDRRVGQRVGMSPTTSTPWALRSSSAETAIPARARAASTGSAAAAARPSSSRRASRRRRPASCRGRVELAEQVGEAPGRSSRRRLDAEEAAGAARA